jgi:hypothetical protein
MVEMVDIVVAVVGRMVEMVDGMVGNFVLQPIVVWLSVQQLLR